ncbi:hypothetical protein EVJ50_03890 [Synechococcus sp. RSCCF101]|uniref:hypothetical protein n=1 Tax=Synechococcus sp. RSCCF101 TaxID=2511069 RepID=UPI001245F1DF|nr:hypothetical protein [Synechococcus sp. RSCCF101]QEY31518.1 hypothetical protein EVJ50_03890 [Synechococcus sp. RSCCF101]
MTTTPKLVVQTPAMRQHLEEIRALQDELAGLKAEKAALPAGAYGRGQATLLTDRIRSIGARIQEHCQALAVLKRQGQAEAPPTPLDAVEPLESYVVRQAKQQLDPVTFQRLIAVATRQREQALERAARRARP